jgi:multiple sugar transport system permease protein
VATAAQTKSSIQGGGQWRRRWQRALVLYIPLFLFLGLTLFPFYWMFVTSIKTNPELINVKSMPLIVQNPTMEHYVHLIRNTNFLRWALNSLAVTVVSTLISLVCGVLAGYSLARLRYRGSQPAGLAIFVTYLVPQTLLFIPLAAVVNNFRLMDSLWSMMLTYPTILIPFCTWMLAGYFRTIPRELEECAMIDGASRLRTMFSIVLPLAMPGVLSAGIFAFTLSWNEYIYAMVLTSSTELKTIPIGVTTELIKGDVFFWGSLMGGALLGSVPVALIYSFFVEHYVAGLTAGAVKG